MSGSLCAVRTPRRPPCPGHRIAVLLAACSMVGGRVQAQQPIGFDSVLALTAPRPAARVGYGGDPLQFGNLRLPPGPGPHPVVVFIHGGCWLSPFTIDHAAPLEQALADRGYAVWSLEYRRVGDPGGGWPGTFRDVAAGADHLRALANAFPLDLSRVVAMGHSAGGQFALWLAARGAIAPGHALHADDPLEIHGALGLAPAPDLEGLHAAGVCGNVIDSLMGGSPAAYPERYRAASPMQLAPIGVPQALVVGALDTRWGPVGRAYYERAVAVGDTRVHLLEAEASGHFDMIAPTTATWPIVVDALDALFRRLAPLGPERP